MGISNLFLDAILLAWSARHLSKLPLKNSHYGDSSPGLDNLSWSIYSGCRGWTIPFPTAAVSPLGYVDVPSVCFFKLNYPKSFRTSVFYKLIILILPHSIPLVHDSPEPNDQNRIRDFS